MDQCPILLYVAFQYCGLYINRGHLVLFDALPGCVIHVTVNELLVEAFRSREGYVGFIACLECKRVYLAFVSSDGS